MPVSVRPSGASRILKYYRQKRKGRPDRAYVRVDGKKVSLGQYGTVESKRKYAAVIQGLEGSKAAEQPPAEVTVSILIRDYLEFAQEYYRKPDGTHPWDPFAGGGNGEFPHKPCRCFTEDGRTVFISRVGPQSCAEHSTTGAQRSPCPPNMQC